MVVVVVCVCVCVCVCALCLPDLDSCADLAHQLSEGCLAADCACVRVISREAWFIYCVFAIH